MKRLLLWLAALAGAVALFASAAFAASAPTVKTGAASAVAPTTATLSGSVNLNGASLTAGLGSSNCYFEYGPTTSYGSTQACANAPASSGTTTVSAKVSGLSGASAYHYQLVVLTGGAVTAGVPTGDTENPGGDATFTTPSATVPPTAATAPASAIAGTSATLNALVNPENWSLSSCSFSYRAAGASSSTASCASVPTGASAQNVSASLTNLNPGTTYTYSLTVGYDGSTVTSASTGSFTTAEATGAPATSVTSTSATLNGSVDPEGQTVTGCTFDYALDKVGANVSSEPCSPAAANLGGTSPVAVSAAVSGLTPKSTYVYAIALTTSAGVTDSGAVTFTTSTSPTTPPAPAARTSAAANVTATTATLRASVDAHGEDVLFCDFQLAVTPITGNPASGGAGSPLVEPCTPVPADHGSQTVSAPLTGLAPDTTYYARIVFVTKGGAVLGSDAFFTTLAIDARPGAKITRASVNRHSRVLSFRFTHTGPAASRSECALVTVTRGRVGTPHYRSCRSPVTYRRLAARTYAFYVRTANAYGWGVAAERRVTL